MRRVFRAKLKEKTVNFEEQIMSKDKYTSIFSRKIEAIVFIILQIFANACKHDYKQLTVCCVGCFILSVLWCDFMNKHMSPFFCKSYIKLLNQIYTKTFRSGRKVWKLGKTIGWYPRPLTLSTVLVYTNIGIYHIAHALWLVDFVRFISLHGPLNSKVVLNWNISSLFEPRAMIINILLTSLSWSVLKVMELRFFFFAQLKRKKIRRVCNLQYGQELV